MSRKRGRNKSDKRKNPPVVAKAAVTDQRQPIPEGHGKTPDSHPGEQKKGADAKHEGEQNPPLPEGLIRQEADGQRQEEVSGANDKNQEAETPHEMGYIRVVGSKVWATCKNAGAGEKIMAALTFVIIVVNSCQWHVTQGQLDQMKAASRAWLGPTNEGPAVRVGPLRVDVRGAVLLEKCEITIRNYGSFPAQDVWTIAKLVVTQIPAKAQEAADAMPAQNTMHPRGIAVFPGSSGQIWERPGQVEPSDRILAKDGRDDFWVYVVGCVLYRDQFGERHHTTFVYGCPKRGTDPDVAFRLDPNTTVETSACIPAGGHIE